jgi:tetrahydromethanopterin:alpha-L-glutamate ligase
LTVDVVVFAEERDWHCARLVAACRERGAAVALESLRSCRFRLGGEGPGIEIPVLEGRLPDVVVVRSIPAGTFEQVTFRLALLHALRELGIRVVNDARAIERCVDKSMTSFMLHHAGIPTPTTFVTESADAAADWHRAQAADIVQKPLFGAQGRGLQRHTAPSGQDIDGLFYLQRYVGRESDWRDFRVFVVADEPVAAMRRNGTSWITNVAQGASCDPVPCSGRLGELAVAAARAVGADYAGVDLIEDEAGSLMVLEVNSMPAWQGLQGVAERNVADEIARHVLRG